MRLVSFIAIAVVLAVGAVAAAQDFPGDPVAGQAYADKACRSCHDMTGSGGKSRSARSFQEIGQDPRMAPMALIAWLTAVSHPTMPNLILSREDARNVVAFILGLPGTRGK